MLLNGHFVKRLGIGMVLVVLFYAPASAAQKPGKRLPAFPGAEGFGACTPGGRGGRIIEVTNLNAKGPGSLQSAYRSAITSSRLATWCAPLPARRLASSMEQANE